MRGKLRVLGSLALAQGYPLVAQVAVLMVLLSVPLGALLIRFAPEIGKALFSKDWTYAASTCTGNRGLKSRLSLPAMSLRRHW
jgi:hypothetical protein